MASCIPLATFLATFSAKLPTNRGLIYRLEAPKYGKEPGGFDSYLFRQIRLYLASPRTTVVIRRQQHGVMLLRSKDTVYRLLSYYFVRRLVHLTSLSTSTVAQNLAWTSTG